MKNLILLLSLAVLFSCNQPGEKKTEEKAEVKKPNTEIGAQSAGDFEIGKIIPTDIPYKLQNRTESVSEEGYTFERTYTDVFRSTEMIMSMETAENKVISIDLFAPDFKTDQGFHVGLTLEEAKKIHPNSKIYYSYVSEMFQLKINKYPNIGFILNNGSFTGNKDALMESDWVQVDWSDFENNAKIEKVMIF